MPSDGDKRGVEGQRWHGELDGDRPGEALGAAKTRLRGALPGVDHEALVLAMALDTVAAALACPVVGRVVVVTGDPAAGRGRLRRWAPR